MLLRPVFPVSALRLATAVCLTVCMMAPLAAQPPPRMSWIRQFGTTRFDQANAVGYGEFGVYTAGATWGNFADGPGLGTPDAFIALHDTAGNLKWIRQFGTPADEDVATGVAGDGSGAYVVGYTAGTTTGPPGDWDSFIRKYGPDGEVLWARQFGSVTRDAANAVATHTSGVYVVGYVDCCTGALPGQPPALGTDAYIRKYSGDGDEIWTRQFGTADIERAVAVAVDESGVYVAGTTAGALAGPQGGRDGFVRKYNHDGALLWTRQFGLRDAAGNFTTDDFYAIATGPAGVFAAGTTARGAPPDMTFAGGLYDSFVVKLDPDNGDTKWYRQIGSDGDDTAYSIAVSGDLVLVGGGTGSDLVSGAYTGGEDAFLRLYDSDGNEIGTQQFGNGLNDSVLGIVSTPAGFFAAGTKNGDALGQQPLGDNDAFVMSLEYPPFVAAGGVLNAASFAPDDAPLAPGSLAVVFGSNLNDGSFIETANLGAGGKIATSLGGAEVFLNGIAAPILTSFPTRITIQIPFELAQENTATLVVKVNGQESFPRTINIAPAAPGFFTRDNTGAGEAVVFHEDGVTPVTRQDPAKRDEVVTFLLTGLGVLNPALETGMPAGNNQAVEQVSTGFAAIDAIIEYAGAAPGLVGFNHIRARVPANAPLRVDVPVRITVGGQQSNLVTVPIGPIPPGG